MIGGSYWARVGKNASGRREGYCVTYGQQRSTEAGGRETRTVGSDTRLSVGRLRKVFTAVSFVSRARVRQEGLHKNSSTAGVSLLFTLSHSRTQKSWFATLYLSLTLFEGLPLGR